jgi:hypothetical protein
MTRRLIYLSIVPIVILVFELGCRSSWNVGLAANANKFDINNVYYESDIDNSPMPTLLDFPDESGSAPYLLIRRSSVYKRSVRFRLSTSQTTPGQTWRLVIRDAGENELAHYSADDITLLPKFVTQPINSQRLLLIRIEGDRPAILPQVRVESALWQRDPWASDPQSPVFQAFAVGDPRLRSGEVAIIHSVAKLTFGDGATCTGFLAAENLLMTNAHCVEHSTDSYQTLNSPRELCRDVTIRFDFFTEHGEDAAPRVACLEVLRTASKIDLVFLKIDPKEAKREGNARATLRIFSGEVNNSMAVFLGGHPYGMPLRFARECYLYLKGNDIAAEHDCETYEGNSGSPIISFGSELIGVHNIGAFDANQPIESPARQASQGLMKRNGLLLLTRLKTELAQIKRRAQ